MVVPLKRCVVIGASPEADAEFIRESVGSDDFVVCADGGYITALRAGLEIDLLIGDFDSSDYPEGFGGEVIRLPVMKDDTDTLSCVRECLRRGYRDFVLLGMTGGRIDHTFANYSVLLFVAENGGRAAISDRTSEITALTGGTDGKDFLTVSNKQGRGFGVFPFGCRSCRVTLRGFLYDIEEAELFADIPVGACNTVVSEEALVRVSDGSAIVMLYESNQK